MNLSIFFQSVRRSVFGGSLTKGQVEGMERIIAYRDEKYPDMSNDELAYVLATIAWETGRKMVPVKEAGGEAYLRSKKYYPFVGVGLVQVTWRENWTRFGIKSIADGLSWPTALHATFAGMTRGMFTGKRLANYIAPGRIDYIGARRIINGTDRAREVAAYAVAFRNALIAASKAEPRPDPVNPAPAMFDRETFRAWLLDALANDEGVRTAVLAIVFPDDNGEIAGDFPLDDPNDEPHEDYGYDESEPVEATYG